MSALDPIAMVEGGVKYTCAECKKAIIESEPYFYSPDGAEWHRACFKAKEQKAAPRWLAIRGMWKNCCGNCGGDVNPGANSEEDWSGELRHRVCPMKPPACVSATESNVTVAQFKGTFPSPIGGWAYCAMRPHPDAIIVSFWGPNQ